MGACAMAWVPGIYKELAQGVHMGVPAMPVPHYWSQQNSAHTGANPKPAHCTKSKVCQRFATVVFKFRYITHYGMSSGRLCADSLAPRKDSGLVDESNFQADKEYEDVGPGGTITKTIVAHELAWQNLCVAYGSTHPRTHKQRISALLKIIEAQQGHNHSTKTYLQQLQRTGQTHTSVEYNVAIGIIRVVAQEVDELAALMDEYSSDAKTSDGDNENGGTSGQDVSVNMIIAPGNCKICNRPGHKARDCLDFLTRSGVCWFWFMNHIGKNEEGCRKGKDCPRTHERPEEEPVEEKVVGVRANVIQVQDVHVNVA